MKGSHPIASPLPAEVSRIAFLVSGAFFMQNLDATIITTSLPQMAASFGTTPVKISIGISSYLFSLAAFIPVSGWVADRFGTRSVFSWALLIFTAASVLCAFSQNLGQFMAARILQGVGGAMMVPVGRMAVLRVTPKEHLLRAISVLVWPGLIAPVIGPTLGGWITATLSWHWVFLVNVPLGLLGFALAFYWIPVGEKQKNPFDVWGFVFSAVGLTALMYGLDKLAHAWAQWPVALGWLVLGAVGTALAVRHCRRARYPMLDFSAMTYRTFQLSCVGGSIFRIAINTAPFLLPLMFQLGFGYDSVKSGMLLLALFSGNLVMKPFTTPILRRFGFRRTLIASGSFTALSFALCALFTSATPMWEICAILFFGGLARSLQFTAANTIAFADVPQKHMSGASTLTSVFQQLNAGVGIAIGALALNFSTFLLGGHIGKPISGDFRLAFVLIAVFAMLGLIDSITLPKNAGASVTGRRPNPQKML